MLEAGRFDEPGWGLEPASVEARASPDPRHHNHASYIRLVLEDVEVMASIGLAAWERQRAQPLVVNGELYADSVDYLQGLTQDAIIDYCRVYDRIQSWRVRAHTELIETLVLDLLEACFSYQRVCACKVSIVKSQVLNHAHAAGAEAFITRQDYCR
jgi:dihydroneopterin aldolase